MDTLPPEMDIQIMLPLSRNELADMCNVNVHFYEVCHLPYFWKLKLIYDKLPRLPLFLFSYPHINWFKAYDIMSNINDILAIVHKHPRFYIQAELDKTVSFRDYLLTMKELHIHNDNIIDRVRHDIRVTRIRIHLVAKLYDISFTTTVGNFLFTQLTEQQIIDFIFMARYDDWFLQLQLVA